MKLQNNMYVNIEAVSEETCQRMIIIARAQGFYNKVTWDIADTHLFISDNDVRSTAHKKPSCHLNPNYIEVTVEQWLDVARTLNELANIKGAFDKGKKYKCIASTDDAVYTIGNTYPCNGEGVVDDYDRGDHTSSCHIGAAALFELVTEKSVDVKFKSGEIVFIAQINTLAGVESKRYFIRQYWCNSGHQQQYAALGIIFNNKEDAEFKCKSLLGIDTRTDEEKTIDDLCGEDNCYMGDSDAKDLLNDIKAGRINDISFTGSKE